MEYPKTKFRYPKKQKSLSAVEFSLAKHYSSNQLLMFCINHLTPVRWSLHLCSLGVQFLQPLGVREDATFLHGGPIEGPSVTSGTLLLGRVCYYCYVTVSRNVTRS